ncbi:VOC family protein [Vibrio rotiferianus]|uniref:VOC family protein n=1 Tax=Vibrio rotiferianus TaxID=190895 RepID=UPI00406A6364
MIDHFEIKVVGFDACVAFYCKVLTPLDIELKWSDETAAGYGAVGEPNTRFLIEKGDQSARSHIAFKASDKASVKAFHTAGVEAGFTCHGEPGLREHYASNYYAAFLYDPDGNNIEAVVYL